MKKLINGYKHLVIVKIKKGEDVIEIPLNPSRPLSLTKSYPGYSLSEESKVMYPHVKEISENTEKPVVESTVQNKSDSDAKDAKKADEPAAEKSGGNKGK